MTQLQELSICLMALPHVKHLHLIPEGPPDDEAEAPSDIAGILFDNHPALAIVDIAYTQMWRFERNSARSEIIEIGLDQHAWRTNKA